MAWAKQAVEGGEMLSMRELLPEVVRECRECDWLSESCDWLAILNSSGGVDLSANWCRSDTVN